MGLDSDMFTPIDATVLCPMCGGEELGKRETTNGVEHKCLAESCGADIRLQVWSDEEGGWINMEFV